MRNIHIMINSKLLHIYRKSSVLSPTDLENMLRLLQVGFTFQQVQTILKNRRNQAIFDGMSKMLINGKTLEESLIPYLPKYCQKHLMYSNHDIALIDSLTIAYDLHRVKNQYVQQLMKICAYPIFVLFLSIGLIFFFHGAILPNLISLFQQQHQSATNLIQQFSFIIQVIYGGMIIVLIILGFILIVYPLKSLHLSIMTFWTSWHLPFSKMLQQMVTYNFVQYFMVCYRHGFSTSQILNILRHHQKPLITQLATTFHQVLSQGISFLDGLQHLPIDPSLIQFLTMAYYTSTTSQMLEQYMTYTLENQQRKVKRIAKWIQCILYGLIGLIFMLLYQALLAPMQMIERMM